MNEGVNPEARLCIDTSDNEIFPSFEDLPDENEIDLRYYESRDGFHFTPSKHWCFLAEIVEIEHFIRFKLRVRDKTAANAHIMFYTENRGREVQSSLMKVGNTVAALSPHRHGFLDMSVGIRHEETSMLRIFPIGLSRLLDLTKKVQQYAQESGGKRVCQGCDRKDTTLKKCARCSVFWYCNKDCQLRAWNEKGHKEECKILKLNDFTVLGDVSQGNMEAELKFTGT